MASRLEVGVIGNGAWGQRIQETLRTKTQHCELGTSFARQAYSPARFEDLKRFDFIIIATPFKTHAQYMRLCLEQGVPFIVEKPAAPYVDLVRLRREFERSHVVPSSSLMLCDHTLLFNPAIEAMREAMQSRTPVTLRGEHGGSGPIRDDCSALLDYGAHGLALAFYLSSARRMMGSTVIATPQTHEGARSYHLWAMAEHLETTLRVSNEYEFKRLKYTVETAEHDTYRFDDRDEHKLYRYSGPRLEALPYAPVEPLTNVLDTFAKAVRIVKDGGIFTDARFGWDLPMAVMRALESAEESLRAEARVEEESHE